MPPVPLLADNQLASLLVSEFAVSNTAGSFFRPMPGHNPRTPQERYRRVHLYVSDLGAKSSALLKKTLLAVRTASERMPDELMRATAKKQFTETEFLPATKELMCIWLHLEAVDQGGTRMEPWLLNYLKLSLYATDYLLLDPLALEVMDSHAMCGDMNSLYGSVALSLAWKLGFGPYARILAPAFIPLLTTTRKTRQKLLHKSLTSTINVD